MIKVLLVISILFQLQPAVSLRGEGQRGRGARQVSGTYMCAGSNDIYIINSNYLDMLYLTLSRYGYYDQAGKLQVVSYTADPHTGFHAEGEHVPRPQYK